MRNNNKTSTKKKTITQLSQKLTACSATMMGEDNKQERGAKNQ
jgi:hypothetical protein